MGFYSMSNCFFKSPALLHPNQQINLCDAHVRELRLRQVQEYSLQEQIFFAARSGGGSVNSMITHPRQNVRVQNGALALTARVKQKETCGLRSATMHIHEVLQCGSAQIKRQRLRDRFGQSAILTNLCGNKSIVNASFPKFAQIIKRILFLVFCFAQEARQTLAGIVAVFPCYKEGEKPECLEFCVCAIEVGDVLWINVVHGNNIRQ